MASIRRCDDHGYFDAAACPDCGNPGEVVLDERRRTRLSKFLSGALRHFPEDADLSLDDRGWADYDRLVRAATERYPWAEPSHVAAVIETDSRGRFERGGDRVRASYGHSVDVSLESTGGDVPDSLYHGTAPENVESILAEGISPMSRQAVHLSGTPKLARDVGRRHADEPVVLEVDAGRMVADGHRIDERGREIYTTERVPLEYVRVRDEEALDDALEGT